MNQASYGETSGFTLVSYAESQTINGGNQKIIWPWDLAILIINSSGGSK
jgi:hypothetical protein